MAVNKRRAPEESDVEDHPEQSQTSKRARTAEDGEDEDDLPPPTRVRKGKGKGKERAVDEDEELNDVEALAQILPDEDEDRRFEEENEEIIREQIENKQKAPGTIAEMGIIEKLEMHNFMCHKYLTFNFGPQINFIIGHNGSGKSAVLSALTVALGGKATATGRGNGLKAFIREGESVSEVSVTIKNRGPEAYKHDQFGDSIIITRRFTKDGSSSYKIKAKDGKIISNKREDLTAICDHMNIQVDNPLNILTQDSARQFLSGSQPAAKYEFFLRGTSLRQLNDEYTACLKSIINTDKILAHKQEAIKDLESAYNEAKSRLSEAQKARELEKRAQNIRSELAWAYVAGKKEELESRFTTLAKHERVVAKAQAELDKADSELQEANQAVEVYEQEIRELGEMKDLKERKHAADAQLKEQKDKVLEFKMNERDMNSHIKDVNAAIEEMKQRIKEDQAKAEASTQSKRDAINQRLEVAETNLESLQKAIDSLKGQIEASRAQSADIKQRGQQIDTDIGGIETSIKTAREQLVGCDEREKSKLAPFGKQMDRVLEDIQRSHWYGGTPIGPLGMFVGLRDRAKWGDLMRAQLGGLMTNFVCTDPRDRKTLADILKRYGNNNGITITKVDLFDFSHGEPPPQYLTALRVLEFTNEFVLRIFVNQAKIESTFIAERRDEGERILNEHGRGGICWTAEKFMAVQKFPEGGFKNTLLKQLHPNDPKRYLFNDSNTEVERRRINEELKRLMPLRDQKERERREMRTEFDGIIAQIKALQSRVDQKIREYRDLKADRDSIREELNVGLPADLQALQEELTTREDEKIHLVKQFTDLQFQKGKAEDALKPFMDELAQAKKLIRDFEERQATISENLQETIATRMTAQNNKRHYAKKLQDAQKKVSDADAEVQAVQAEFENWRKRAVDICADEIEEPRSADELKRLLTAVEKALKAREKTGVPSVDEMAAEVMSKKEAYDKARKDISQMRNLNQALRKAIHLRIHRWHEFRRSIALRCKVYFQYNLSHRGYYGKILFDHTNGTLLLKVQTEDQTATQGTREKDPRSLSGGEKSFSTICLLLSLWESIGCPIRCLDEFDVFMDAVNRRISMKMMIDTANASNRKQYILITPQDMTNVQFGASVRVHRMTDPERGQGVLAFQ